MKPAILVLGADGPVGRGVVRAALDGTRPVVAVARDPLALGDLCRAHRGAPLRTLAADVSDEAPAERLVGALRKLPHPFLGVVVAMEPTGQRGRLLDAPAACLRAMLEETVVPQLVAARHLLPWLASTGRNCGYVVVGGPGSRHPWAGYAHQSVAAAALSMLARALHDEAVAHAVRLQLLDVDAPLRCDRNAPEAGASLDGPSPSHERWPTAVEIGRRAVALLEHRNDARCTSAVVGYHEANCFFEATDAGARAGSIRNPARPATWPSRQAMPWPADATDVESPLPQSSDFEDPAAAQRTPLPDTTAPGVDATQPSHESDGAAGDACARWSDDVRRLLASLSLPKSKQERSP